ncbi:MAG TPA: CAP domain-containing protein [Euzebyales bacterium]|nr:CAP domain-containing protein [Euzebyales bacterium]
MVHQPRRRTARLAGLALCGVIMLGLLLGMTRPSAVGSARAQVPDDAAAAALDSDALRIYRALNRLRDRTGLPALAVDDDLVDSAERDACAIARGEVRLSGSAGRLEESGGQRENVGLVVEDDPALGARTMHDWWTRSRDHRTDRLDPDMRRYGIGTCVDQDRTYYVERFAS